jgi:ribonuclease Z
VFDYHSTVEDAARTAARGGVGTLVLTLLVPAPRPEAEQEWSDRAPAHFDGTIVVARDVTTLDVGA